MANRMVFVSDLDGKELTEDEAVKITVTDKKNETAYVVDANRNDPGVKILMEKGKKQAVRGRKEKAEAAK